MRMQSVYCRRRINVLVIVTVTVKLIYICEVIVNMKVKTDKFLWPTVYIYGSSFLDCIINICKFCYCLIDTNLLCYHITENTEFKET